MINDCLDFNVVKKLWKISSCWSGIAVKLRVAFLFKVSLYSYIQQIYQLSKCNRIYELPYTYCQ